MLTESFTKCPVCGNKAKWKNYSSSWGTEEEYINCPIIEFNGKNQSMSNWAKEINIPYQTLKSRINSMGVGNRACFDNTCK